MRSRAAGRRPISTKKTPAEWRRPGKPRREDRIRPRDQGCDFFISSASLVAWSDSSITLFPISNSYQNPNYGNENSVTVWVDGQAYQGLAGHTVGRDDTASITVDHAQVSRQHASLQFDGINWSIQDLGSTNGLHDENGRHQTVTLPVGRTQVWLGPPESSPCLYFDVEGAPQPPVYDPGPQGPAPVPGPGFGGPQGGPAPPPAPGFGGPSGQPGGGGPPPPPGYSSNSPPAQAAKSVPAGASAVAPSPSPPPSAPPVAAPPLAPSPGPPANGSPPPPSLGASYSPPSFSPSPAAGAEPRASPPPPPVNLNSAQLQQNIGELSQVIKPVGSELVVGRATECDISIADPLVSRTHARLILNANGGRIIDLGSDNGTFVNGQRITDSPVVEGDLIELGKAQFILSGGQLQQHVAHGLPLQADGLTVSVNGGDLTLLNDVSFSLPAGSMTAVIGPSGSGKSTLLNALTGQRPANSGRVLLGGRDLYSSDEGLGRRIGFVPQDDPVHETLTVRQALMAAARLRLPSDISAAEIADDVASVAEQLGLTERLDTRVKALSGGQRKRVSVGYELVGEPQALILDEPTSGLDPGLERELMGSLRGLANKGTTTIVVTHSVQSVELCDLVLVLAPGGRLAFIGPPDKVSDHFRCPDMASVFTLLGTRQRAEWELEFAQTTSYLKFGAQAPISAAGPSVALPNRSFTYDLRVMVVRYLKSLIGDRRRSLLLVLQAPFLGLLLSAVLFREAFAPEPGPATRQYLLATVLAMTWLGGSNSVREIVQERDVFRREMAVGVSAMAYVLSRWLVLGLATTFQAVVLHLVASSRQINNIGSGAIISAGQLELVAALAGVGVASVGIGLFISAQVSDTSKALTALPLVIIPTLLLSGLVVPTSGRMGIQEFTYLNPVQWGGSAAAVAVDLRSSEGCPPGDVIAGGQGAAAGLGAANEACSNPRWERNASTQYLNFGLLLGWCLVLLAGAGLIAGWTLKRPLKRS